MLLRKRDLANISDEKNIDIDIKCITLDNDPYLKRLENTKGYICFYYDYSDKLTMEYELSGQMVCPDIYTLKDVYVDYNLTDNIEVVYSQDEDGFLIEGDIEIDQLVLNIVLPEVPISVENKEKMSYHIGDGWSVMSEEEYDKTRKDKIDPRLQVLKDYKEEK